MDLGDEPAGGDGSNESHRSDAQERTERAIALSLLSLRGMHLIQASASTAVAWSAYRRPRLALGLLALSATESAWLARRLLRGGLVDDATAAWVDAAVGVSGIVGMGASTEHRDRTSWMNWMLPVTLDTAVIATVALRRPRSVAVVGGLLGAFFGSMAASVRADPSLVTGVVAGALGYPLDHVAADRFVGHLRRSADELERAQHQAVQRGQELAAERERSRLRRGLNSSAVASLRVIAAGWDDGQDAAVRARMRREAARLRSALSRERETTAGSLSDALHDLADDVALDGLGVELIIGDLGPDLVAPRQRALLAGATEALHNAARHSGVTSVVVRARCDADDVEVTIRDHGVGFEVDARAPGEGITTGILYPLRDAGGGAEVTSTPDRGTRVVLRVPR